MFVLYAPESVERAYMGTDARIFEPLLGAMGAVLVASPRGRARLQQLGRPSLAIGAVVVAAGLILLPSGTALYFHGGALVFSLATLLIVASIWVGAGGWAGRVLSWAPIAWIGVISYGIYLWHWPLILWLGVRDERGARRAARDGRRRADGGRSRSVVLPRGTSDPVGAWQSVRGARAPIQPALDRGRRHAARSAPPGLDLDRRHRRPPPAPGTPVVMVVGDSVPERLAVPLERAMDQRGWRMVSAAHGGCSVTGETNSDTGGVALHESNACAETIVPEQDELIREVDPQVVVWWDRWVLYDFLTAEGEHVQTGTARFWALRKAGLESAVRRLTAGGATVAFVGVEPPGAGICGDRTLAACGERLRFRVEHYHDITARWNAIMQGYARRHPDLAEFIDITHSLCHEETSPCDDRVDGVPARPDGTHYGGPGGEFVAALLADDIAPWVTPGSSPESSPSPSRVPPPAPGTPVVMVVGDSVPERLAVPLERAMDRRGWRMVSAAHGGCSVTGETNSDTGGVALHESNACAETIVPEQDELIREVDPQVVVWWDRWVLYDFLTAEGEHVQTGTARFWALRKAGLESAVRRLTAGGATVAFVGVEPPGAGICGDRTLAACGERLRFRVEHYHDITARWNAIMQGYARRHPDLAEFIDITHSLCHEETSPCDDRVDGVPARPDGTHYGGPGGEFVAALLADDIAPWVKAATRIAPDRSPRRPGMTNTTLYATTDRALGRNRTCDTRFRKPVLYPLSYEGEGRK